MSWDKDETLATSGSDMPVGECKVNAKAKEANGSGDIASGNALSSGREAAQTHVSTDDIRVDESSTLKACDDELPVVSCDGNVLGVDESSNGPIWKGDRALSSCAAEPERVLAIAGVAAISTAEANGHR